MDREYAYRLEGGSYLRNFRTEWDTENSEYIAEEAAKHYYHDCDGGESPWPIKFYLYHENDLLGFFEVDLDYEPEFIVSTKREVENEK